jgi:FAD/FMN-containing dehydrogenase
VKLAPLPRYKTLGVVNFPSFHRAMAVAQHIVTLRPSAVELVDRTMIELSRRNPAFRPVIERALIGEPEAILLVEFMDQEEPPSKLRELVAHGCSGLPGCVVR